MRRASAALAKPAGRPNKSGCAKSRESESRRLLAALKPHLATAGITRLGDLTGLDVLGIPVAFAARPNSRSLSVTQGKAMSLDEAMVGAAMEAMEQAFAEREEELIVARCATSDLRARGLVQLDLTRVARVARIPNDDQIVAWSSMRSLRTGARVVAPFELVGLDLRSDKGWDVSAIPVSSLGLAAHRSPEAAATHALLEVIEHNATAALDLVGMMPGFARPVRYRAGHDEALDAIASRIVNARLTFELFDIASPAGLPTIAATLYGSDLGDRPIQFAGFACRFSQTRAAEAALLEAVQSRLTLIAGARDDITKSSYAGNHTGRAWAKNSGPFLDELSDDFAEISDARDAERLRCAVDAALRLGATDIYAAQLGQIDGLVYVVRVVVTGLEASGFNATASLGRRTLEELFRAGGGYG